MWSCASGEKCEEVAALLLKAGADANARDKQVLSCNLHDCKVCRGLPSCLTAVKSC